MPRINALETRARREQRPVRAIPSRPGSGHPFRTAVTCRHAITRGIPRGFGPTRGGAVVVALLTLAPVPALGRATAPEGTRPLATAPLFGDPGREAADGRADAASGVVRTRFGVGYVARREAPENMAREYLRATAAELGMEADLSDLELVRVQTGIGTRHVRFRQTWRGVPVHGSDVVVSLREADDAVTAVASDYKPGVMLREATPTLAAAAAERIALEHLRPRDEMRPDPRSELLIWSHGGDHRLAWRVAVVLADPRGDWEVFVDARTGEVFSVRDQMWYSHGMPVNGRGLAFNPDPISTAGQPYGPAGLVDGDDATSPALDALRMWVPLYDIWLEPGPRHLLTGPACVIGDFPGDDGKPLGDSLGAYVQTRADGFVYTRDQQGFEAVMVYAHITNLQYWLQHLGFVNVNNDQDLADPHGLDGMDNSFYCPTEDALAFGEGLVDDAEDAGTIVHEYGHAIQNDQVPGWGRFLESSAMGEGFGDYLAGSYVGALSNYQSDWVMKWDGALIEVNGAPAIGDAGLRRLNSQKTYPDSLAYEAHDDGEIWSACLWEIHQALGRVPTDRLVIQSHFYLTPGATFRDGALAILQADMDLTSGANEAVIRDIFTRRGILKTNPFAVAQLVGSDQTRPAIAFDRVPDGYPRGWGRRLLVAWQDARFGLPGRTFAQHVGASDSLRPPELDLGDFLLPDIACAPAQPWPNNVYTRPRFLVVGQQDNETSDIVGVLVDSAQVTALPGIAGYGWVHEMQPAVDAVDSTYLVAYLVDETEPGMSGSPWVRARRVEHDGTVINQDIELISGPAQWDVDVGAGYDSLGQVGQFLVVWTRFDVSTSAIEAARVDRFGNVLGPFPIVVAVGSLATEFHQLPAVAFDGANYLVVWRRTDMSTGLAEIRGRTVDPSMGGLGVPFTIGPPPAGRSVDVAFDGRQYCVVWETSPLSGDDPDVLAVRIDPQAGIIDGAEPLPLATSDLREHRPRVTAVSGREPGTAGRGFCVAWDQGPVEFPQNFDVWARFVPDSMPPIPPPPAPLPLGVNVEGFPDSVYGPGHTVWLSFTVQNTGHRKDGFRLTATGTKTAWTHTVQPLVVLNPGEGAEALVGVAIPANAAVPDTDWVTLTARSVTDTSVADAALGRVQVIGVTGPASMHRAELRVGNVISTVTDQGIYGYLSRPGRDPAPRGAQPQVHELAGSGFVFPRIGGANRLFIGSFVAGTDSSYVLNRDYDADPIRDWTPAGRLWPCGDPEARCRIGTSFDPPPDQSFFGVYTDSGHTAPRGLTIIQESFAWAAPPDDDYVILAIRAAHPGPEPLCPLWLGQFMDWDLAPDQDYGADRGRVDRSRDLVYMWRSSGEDSTYVGIKSLSYGPAQLSLIRNRTYIAPDGYLRDEDRFHFLTGDSPEYVVDSTEVADDWSVLLGFGPFVLYVGDTLTAGIAVVAGSSLGDLFANADAAQAKWDRATGVLSAESLPTPGRTRFEGAAPNPFRAGTRLVFALARRAPVSLRVYDVGGREVARVTEGTLDAGRHGASWNGTDWAGRALPSGIYFARLRVGREAWTRKLLLTR